MGKSIDDKYNKYDKFIEMLDFKNGKQTKIQIFKDLVVILAIKIKNSVYYEKIDEDTYKTILSKYEKEEIETFNKLIENLTDLYEDDNEIKDILGEIFECLGGNQEYTNRVLTPISLSDVQARTIVDIEKIKQKRVTTIQNKYCNAGSLMLSVAKYLQSNNIDYTKKIYIDAEDTELVYVCMAYIQFSLYGLSACVIWKNEKTDKIRRIFYTPQYYMCGWFEMFKIDKLDKMEEV